VSIARPALAAGWFIDDATGSPVVILKLPLDAALALFNDINEAEYIEPATEEVLDALDNLLDAVSEQED